MTAAEFKRLIFSVLDFALTNIMNMIIFMISDYFCLLPASFCNVIVNMRDLESHVIITDRCAPRKTTNGTENLTLQALKLQ
jgi:hypothetical protein